MLCRNSAKPSGQLPDQSYHQRRQMNMVISVLRAFKVNNKDAAKRRQLMSL